MKVAIVVPQLTGGGAEAVARSWASGLQTIGIDVHVLIFDDSTPPTQERFRVYRFSRKKGFIHRIRKLRAELIEQRFDAVLTLMPYANLLGLFASMLMKRGQRPLVIISEHTVHKKILSTRRMGHKIQLALAQILYRGADGFVAVSHAVATQGHLSFGLRPHQIWVVPNSTATMQQRRHTPPSVPDGTTLSIIVPGRLVREKRPAIALEVAAIVSARTGKRVGVHFYGSGPLEDELRRSAANQHFDVQFHGWVGDWRDEAPSDGVVLLTSALEGFGNVLVEAAAYRIPSVASSRALGVADACIPGITAILAAADSPQSYAAAVIHAASIEVPAVDGWLDRFSEEKVSMLLQSLIVTTQNQRGLTK